MDFARRKLAKTKIIQSWGDQISRLKIRSEKLGRDFDIESLSFEDDLKVDRDRMEKLRWDLKSSLKIEIDSDQYSRLCDDRLTVGKLLDFIASI